MNQVIVTDNEVERLRALRELGLLDTPPEERFDRITRLAKAIFNTSIVLISFVDEENQFFKSSIGISITKTPRNISFCAHAIVQDQLMIIEDALLDERFKDNPLVTGEPHIRFYAGAVLRSYDGFAVGTLCIIDTKPRTLTTQEQVLLADLAQGAQNELHLHYMNALLRENQRLAWITEQTANGVLYTDANKKIVWCNEGFSLLSGYSLAELKGKTPAEVLQGEETSDKTIKKLRRQINAGKPFEADILNYHKLGRPYWVHVYGRPLQDESNHTYGYIAIQRDITARVNRYLELEKLAHLDGLTGLTNRRYLEAHLEKMLLPASANTTLALFIIDLNGFKEINDTYGHLSGDDVLCEIASRLINVSRQEDLIARLGGDEFAMVIADVTSVEIEQICERLLKSCLNPIIIENSNEVAVGMSIGVARFPQDGTNLKSLFNCADKAMYHAKHNQLGASLYATVKNR